MDRTQCRPKKIPQPGDLSTFPRGMRTVRPPFPGEVKDTPALRAARNTERLEGILAGIAQQCAAGSPQYMIVNSLKRLERFLSWDGCEQSKRVCVQQYSRVVGHLLAVTELTGCTTQTRNAALGAIHLVHRISSPAETMPLLISLFTSRGGALQPDATDSLRATLLHLVADLLHSPSPAVPHHGAGHSAVPLDTLDPILPLLILWLNGEGTGRGVAADLFAGIYLHAGEASLPYLALLSDEQLQLVEERIPKCPCCEGKGRGGQAGAPLAPAGSHAAPGEGVGDGGVGPEQLILEVDAYFGLPVPLLCGNPDDYDYADYVEIAGGEIGEEETFGDGGVASAGGGQQQEQEQEQHAVGGGGGGGQAGSAPGWGSAAQDSAPAAPSGVMGGNVASRGR